MAMRTPTSGTSETDNRPPKRMRIGTRSCTECRRRKVRCTFKPQSQTCEGCAIHETPCQTQQPTSLPAREAKASSEASQTARKLHGDQSLHQRLEGLEHLVRHICKAIDLNMESSSIADFQTNAAEAFNRIAHGLTPKAQDIEGISTHTMESSQISDFESISTYTNQMDRFEDAPLISLFKEAKLVQMLDMPADKHQIEPCLEQLFRTNVKTLHSMIPQPSDLDSIFELTRHCWPTWPIQPVSPNNTSISFDGIQEARDFVQNSFRSDSPGLVAKAALWLALCIQQLPRSFQDQHTELPASQTDLLNSNLDIAENIISVNADLGSSIDYLECLTLQSKVYIDLGKPKKAWLSIRRAINLSLLLGLHHPEEGTDVHRRNLWSYVWQTERQLSMILGLPSAITESHPSLSRLHAGDSVAEKTRYNLSIISGHIIERDQNHRSVKYSTTVQIEQELEQCKNEIPSEWWDAIPGPDMSFLEIYVRQVTKLSFFQLQKFLHLPYMLNAVSNSKYEHSRRSSVVASREMIKCYQTLRQYSGGAFFMCDLMDFQTFSAALVIMIDLLSPKPTRERDEKVEAEDWRLIQELTLSLKHISSTMECSVASQAVEVLEYLSMTHYNTYSGPDSYEVVIPYFGKVRISRFGKSTSQRESTSSGDLHSDATQPTTLNTVEFNSNSFPHFSSNLVADSLSDAELGIDWTSVFDMDSDYDWSKVFDNTVPR